ncbi:MAG: type II toxin-antitoxin system VapC family toxin [Dehalococcoidia bacterium]
MILIDVNVLVYAFRDDSRRHNEYRHWLESIVASDSAFGVSDVVFSSFIRVVTNPRIFALPSSHTAAFDFADKVQGQPNCVLISAGSRHWEIFRTLCVSTGAHGGGVPDAYIAALAIESGSEVVTADRGFRRFPGLNWRHPLGGEP